MTTTWSSTSSPRAAPIEREQSDQSITVDELAPLVDGEEAIGITVEGDAEIGAFDQHRPLERFGVGRAATIVDVATIGRGVQHGDAGAEATQRLGSNG